MSTSYESKTKKVFIFATKSLKYFTFLWTIPIIPLKELVSLSTREPQLLSMMSKFQQQEVIQKQEELATWIDKYEALKVANSMLGSNENKRDTKLKINTLIRDLDHCIAQLSE